LMSLPAPRPGEQVSPLTGAGLRSGNASGPTAHYWIRQPERSRSGRPPGQCAYQRHLFFCNAWLTRSSLPSSARFPLIDIRSRNRSPPSTPVPGRPHRVTPGGPGFIPVTPCRPGTEGASSRM
jgi:hypothetical protein